MSSTAPHPALSHCDLAPPSVVAPPPLFAVGCRVVSVVPLVAAPSLVRPRCWSWFEVASSLPGCRSGLCWSPPVVGGRCPCWSVLACRRSSSCRCRSGLVGSVADRLWGVVDQLVVRRRALGPRSRCIDRRSASSGSVVVSSGRLSPVAVDVGGVPSPLVVGRYLPVVGPCSSPLIPCPLRRSLRVPSTIISLIVFALSASRLPLFPPSVSWLRPDSFATRLSTELHLP